MSAAGVPRDSGEAMRRDGTARSGEADAGGWGSLHCRCKEGEG